MIDFLFYSLQLSVCLVLLYLPYHFIFKKTTFYKWNRVYLLGAVFFALLAPLGDFQVRLSVSKEVQSLTTTFSESNIFPGKEREFLDKSFDENATVTLREQSISTKPNLKTDTATTDINWLLVAYFTGVAIFALLYCLRLLKLFLLIKKGKQYQHRDFTEVGLSAESKQVFSFFGFVFLNRTQFTEYELATVLKHEQVHIRYWHSVDVLLMELLQIVFWFNPLFWLYNKSLQNENEYFADQLVAGKQNASTYAETLLQLAVSKRPVTGQAFAYIPVKHRIFKLFQSPSTTMEKSKYLSALPLLSLLFICFSCSFEELDETTVSDFAGEKVRVVKAYYTNEQAEVKSKEENGYILFDQQGRVEKWEDKRGSSYVDVSRYAVGNLFHFSNFHAALFSKNTLLSEDQLAPDFYTKKAQWLLGRNLGVSPEVLETIFHKENPYLLLKLEEELLINEHGYSSDKELKSENEISFTVMQDARLGKALLSKKVVLNEDGLIANWYDSFVFSADFRKVLEQQNKLTKEELNALETIDQFSANNEITTYYDVAYNSDNLPERLVTTFYNEAYRIRKEDLEIDRDIRFIYNDQQQLKELEMYNSNGIFLRSFQYTYNEAGYCTQKRMINREGSVEFTVDFEYDFYPAE